MTNSSFAISPEVVNQPQSQPQAKKQSQWKGRVVKVAEAVCYGLKRLAHYIAATVVELLVALACVLAYSTALFSKEPARGESEQAPILLVHGYLSHGSHWAYMKHRLKKANIGPVYTINLGTPFHSIEEYAEKVKKKAEEIAKRTGRSDLRLVGHSMGGLVSSYYATHLAPEKSVTDIVTLGTPLQGTIKAKIGIGKCAKQMRHHSPFTQELAQKIKQADHIRFYHMGSKADVVVLPNKGALPKRPNPNSKTEMFSTMGHVSFMFSEKVADKIISHMKDPEV